MERKLFFMVPCMSAAEDYWRMCVELGEWSEHRPSDEFTDEWTDKTLQSIIKRQDGAHLPTGRVPETMFWVTEMEDRGHIVAVVTVRHYLSFNLLKWGGHIKVVVRPSERGKGYGSLVMPKAVRMAKSGQFKIDNVVVTCDLANKRALSAMKHIAALYKPKKVKIVRGDGVGTPAEAINAVY